MPQEQATASTLKRHLLLKANSAAIYARHKSNPDCGHPFEAIRDNDRDPTSGILYFAKFAPGFLKNGAIINEHIATEHAFKTLLKKVMT